MSYTCLSTCFGQFKRHRQVYYKIFTGSNHYNSLRYKSEGRGFDSRWCYWNFSFT